MATRGKSACWKCKERRVKCTAEKPACAHCVRLGHKCEYGLRLLWKEDALMRGICFGREGVYSKSKKGKKTTKARDEVKLLSAEFRGNRSENGVHFINTSFKLPLTEEGEDRPWPSELEHFEDSEDGLLRGQRNTEISIHEHANFIPIYPLNSYSNSTSLLNNPSPYGPLPLTDLYYLTYFTHSICPNLSITSTSNPYLQFLLPLSLTSTPLLNVLLSISAAEMRHLKPGDRGIEEVSLGYKVRALKGLRGDIEAAMKGDREGKGREGMEGVVGTVLMLCFLEITNACSPIWLTHLRAARSLCNIMLQTPSHTNINRSLNPSFSRFCIMYFVAHEVMSRTAFLQEAMFETRTWWAGEEDTEVDSMMGCSRGLMHLLSEICTLILDVREKRCADGSKGFLERKEGIERELHSLRQFVTAQDESENMEDGKELLRIAETKRLSALIYFYTSIDHATPSTGPIISLTSQTIALLKSLPAKSTLIFSLFVVGTLGVREEEDRRLVLDMFEKLIRKRRLASLVRARSVVVGVWVDRDLGRGGGRWEELVEGRGGGLSLA